MKRKRTIALIFIILLIIFTFSYYQNENEKCFSQTVLPIDISIILQNKSLTDAHYKTLFYQTGLGRVAIDDIMQSEDGMQKILSFQKSYLKKPDVKCESLIPFLTSQEILSEKFPLAPYKNGYILITKSTHTSIFRHGHAAIVVDAKNGKILESFMLGTKSQISNIDYWTSYSSFIMLKPKNMGAQELDDIATYAREHLTNIPYEITTGLFNKFVPVEELNATQCSHLVWYPYKKFGYDIDSNGGWLVTAKDIVNSPLLEVVQIYGVNPDSIWR